MPIYEYRCRSCDTAFEHFVLSRNESVTCPKCGGGEVERQLSVFSSIGSKSESTEVAAGSGCGCTPQTCGCR